jgi:hypothetical protein
MARQHGAGKRNNQNRVRLGDWPMSAQIEPEMTRSETDEKAIIRLAALSPLELDRCVQAEANALAISVTTLRKQVGMREWQQ